MTGKLLRTSEMVVALGLLLSAVSVTCSYGAELSDRLTLRPWALSVIAFDARPDGITDCTAAFQAALDAVGNQGGGIVEVPAGLYRINGHLRIPAGVTLRGTFEAPPTNRHEGFADLHGSVLLAIEGRGQEDGPPFILLDGNMATLKGVIVHYPEQDPAAGAPAPYPWCIANTRGVDNVAVIDCLLINPYQAIGLDLAGRHFVRNVYGYPIKTGIYVNECYDIGRIENCHFWPFGVSYNPDDPYCQWINLNGRAFVIERTDWQFITNTFCFGYGIGYLFDASPAGTCNGNFAGIGADSCETAVQVNQCWPYGLLITNGEFVGRWTSKQAVAIRLAPTNSGMVSLTNCSFWGPLSHVVEARGPGRLTLNACNFEQWDVAKTGAAAVDADEGIRLIVQGCTFQRKKLAVRLGPGVAAAVVIGNLSDGGLRVQNEAGQRAQIGLNQGGNDE